MVELLLVKYNYVIFLFCDEVFDCVDELLDCVVYGQFVCVVFYDMWVRKNCVKICKYCGKCLFDVL